MNGETKRDIPSGDETRRLFIALPLPGAVRESIREAQRQLRGHGWPVKWVDPDLVHITMKFLGETAVDMIPDIEARLEQVALDYRPVHLKTAGCGAFPSLSRPQVLWLGVHGNVDGAGKLAGSIDETLSALGFEAERRPFRPHITLGRVRRGEKLPGDAGRRIDNVRTEPVPLEIDRFHLVQSILGRSGPSYTTLAEWRLGAGRTNAVELVEHG